MNDNRESPSFRRKVAIYASPEVVAFCLSVAVVLVALVVLRGVFS